ncbi:hypothetical protein [Fusobacterium sp. CM22]|jgi:hypothetical protein|uniref:hypothetical protein n=1 Tax=Fusobacterium sp. CM22 TaxID=936563 RepID=UPI000449868C|nr:hypothetical protein [Fusobacterium sp. CM22]EUB15727.1 hypothetical protein HMPREF1500_0917 [Fusobacterium sp. CM22]
MKKIIIGLMLILNGLCIADFQLKDMSEFRYDNAYIGLILVTEDDRLLMEVKINQQGGESVSSLIDIDRNAIKTIKRTYVNNEHIYPKMLKYLELDGNLWCTDWDNSRKVQQRMFRDDIYSRMTYDNFILYIVKGI